MLAVSEDVLGLAKRGLCPRCSVSRREGALYLRPHDQKKKKKKCHSKEQGGFRVRDVCMGEAVGTLPWARASQRASSWHKDVTFHHPKVSQGLSVNTCRLCDTLSPLSEAAGHLWLAWEWG